MDCKAARIVYLAPAVSKPKNWIENDKAQSWLCFKDLAPDIQSPFTAHWKVIHDRLITLDKLNRRTRNDQPETIERDNYQGRESYQEILARCKCSGNSIVVGFEGGINALKVSDIASLKARIYKWDSAEQGKGSKQGKNWIPGHDFLFIIENLLVES